MNPLTVRIKIGTIGELLVMLKLLQYGVQSVPPLKDSGNDLIAILENEFRAIQVKTRRGESVQLNDLPEFYHIVALVHLIENDDSTCNLENSKVFLLTREDIENGDSRTYRFENLQIFELSQDRVNNIFNYNVNVELES